MVRAQGVADVAAMVEAARRSTEDREAALREQINAALQKIRAYARDMEVCLHGQRPCMSLPAVFPGCLCRSVTRELRHRPAYDPNKARFEGMSTVKTMLHRCLCMIHLQESLEQERMKLEEVVKMEIRSRMSAMDALKGELATATASIR